MPARRAFGEMARNLLAYRIGIRLGPDAETHERSVMNMHAQRLVRRIFNTLRAQLIASLACMAISHA